MNQIFCDTLVQAQQQLKELEDKRNVLRKEQMALVCELRRLRELIDALKDQLGEKANG